MEPPDVIGLILDEALSEIRDKGFFIDKILITKPVNATEPLGIARVLRLSPVGEAGLKVVVAFQDYGKGGVQYGI
ncbi:MAG: hypothetical protein ACYC21_03340 [Eubacteriales bacterium]